LKVEDRKTMQEIMGKMSCPESFICAELESEMLCKTKDNGMDAFLDCFAEKRSHCTFTVPFGDNDNFCSCPLRVFLCKELKL